MVGEPVTTGSGNQWEPVVWFVENPVDNSFLTPIDNVEACRSTDRDAVALSPVGVC